MNEIWLALPAGILISTVVSSVGIGGGILWMPFLLFVFKKIVKGNIYFPADSYRYTFNL